MKGGVNIIIHSVSDINKYIKALLDKEKSLRALLVRGEISNFKQYPSSGHCYFSLKDNGSILRCVMFKSWSKYIRFVPKNGMRVIVGGSISLFEKDGQYQLYVNNIVPDGAGALAVAYEQLKEKLSTEGLFSEERKKKLPFLPHKIGVVTSISGAVLHDIHTVIRRRSGNIKLIVYPVAVQGIGAAEQIEKAIRFFNESFPVDLIILARGGGSAEDLWAFNEEKTVRAVAGSKIPVISAVGHETDFSLADFAADVRAATPSQAAEIAVKETDLLRNSVLDMQNRLQVIFNQKVQQKKMLTTGLTNKLYSMDAKKLLRHKYVQYDALRNHLNELAENEVINRRRELALCMERLKLLNPMYVLERGYSMIEKGDRIITNVKQIALGDELKVKLSDGVILAKVMDRS